MIVPSVAGLEEWCKNNDVPADNTNAMIENIKVIEAFNKVLEDFNESFSHTEQIKKFKLLPDEWSVDTSELTPTLKLKRKNILKKYENQIEEMYDLEDDPKELMNVADNAAYATTKAGLEQAASDWWRRTDGRDFNFYDSPAFREQGKRAF